jgi:hypothetical protein
MHICFQRPNCIVRGCKQQHERLSGLEGAMPYLKSTLLFYCNFGCQYTLIFLCFFR